MSDVESEIAILRHRTKLLLSFVRTLTAAAEHHGVLCREVSDAIFDISVREWDGVETDQPGE